LEWQLGLQILSFGSKVIQKLSLSSSLNFSRWFVAQITFDATFVLEWLDAIFQQELFATENY
jgi:hypothetical protein